MAELGFKALGFGPRLSGFKSLCVRMQKYLGRWVSCPQCGSGEATATDWNDEVSFQCPDCGHSKTIGRNI